MFFVTRRSLAPNAGRAGLATIAAAACLVALPASPAFAADEVVPWPVAPMAPANGGTYQQQFRAPGEKVGSAPVEVQSPAAFPTGRQAVIEVSAETTLGQDGTLADDKIVSLGTAYPRDSDPSKFYGTMSAGALLRPGTYYFQWSLRHLDFSYQTTGNCPGWTPGASASCRFVSPIFTFTIVAPPPAPAPAASPPARAPSSQVTGSDDSGEQELERSEAVSEARDWLRSRYRSWRKGTKRSVTCRATDYAWQRRCAATWRYKRKQYRITLIIQEYTDSLKVKPGRLRRAT
jgi:hypothetical protein